MSVTWADQRDVGMTSGRWQQVADRLAWYGWLVLLVAILVALVGGIVYAAIWEPRAPDAQVVVPGRDACPNPPCFGGGGMPGLRDLPWVVSMLGYGLAILLGMPSLLAAAWDLMRGRWGTAGRRMLPFVGPLLFLFGTEIVPHLLSPCFLALELGDKRMPGICEYGEWGADLVERWHLLDHTLVGAIPFAVLYWLALRKWRPDISRLPSVLRR